MRSDEIVVLGEDSLTTANAGSDGEGGAVVAFSPDTAVFSEGAQIEAQGGSISGNGGFVEVSGKEAVVVAGAVDTRAGNGKTGTFLIDPGDVTISDGSGSGSIILVSDLESWLAGNDVTIDADDYDGGHGWLCVDNAIGDNGAWSSNNSLTLRAYKYLHIDAGVANTGSGNLTLIAQHGGIGINAPISLSGGLLDVLANQSTSYSWRYHHLNINESLAAAGMRLKAGCDAATAAQHYGVFVADDVSLTGTTGDVIIEAAHDIVLGGAVSAGRDIFINADEAGWGNPKGPPANYHPSHIGGGDVWAKGALTAGGSVDVKGNAIKLEDSISANGGDLTIVGRSSMDGSPATGPGGLGVSWGDIEVSSGKVLYASGNVNIVDNSTPSGQPAMTVTGHDSLVIESATGSISSPETFVQVSGSTLTLRQSGPLDLTNLNFWNQSATDVILISNDGSITAVDTANGGKDENAADQWASIEATARNDIHLQGSGPTRDITAKAVTSYEGGIEVASSSRKVLATEEIKAVIGSVSVGAGSGTDASADRPCRSRRVRRSGLRRRQRHTPGQRYDNQDHRRESYAQRRNPCGLRGQGSGGCGRPSDNRRPRRRVRP